MNALGNKNGNQDHLYVCVFVYVCVLLGSLGLLFEYLFKANYLLDIGAYLLYSSRTVPVKGDK